MQDILPIIVQQQTIIVLTKHLQNIYTAWKGESKIVFVDIDVQAIDKIIISLDVDLTNEQWLDYYVKHYDDLSDLSNDDLACEVMRYADVYGDGVDNHGLVGIISTQVADALVLSYDYVYKIVLAMIVYNPSTEMLERMQTLIDNYDKYRLGGK